MSSRLHSAGEISGRVQGEIRDTYGKFPGMSGNLLIALGKIKIQQENIRTHKKAQRQNKENK